MTAGIIKERSHIRQDQHVLIATMVPDGVKTDFAIVSHDSSSASLSCLSVLRYNLFVNTTTYLFMAALRSRCGHYIFVL